MAKSDHMWLIGVLNSVSDYASRNNLPVTAQALDAAYFELLRELHDQSNQESDPLTVIEGGKTRDPEGD